MWRYFNILEPTPMNITVFVLFIGFCGCAGAIGYLEILGKNSIKYAILQGSLPAILWALFLLWLFMGDSVGPTKEVGEWIRGVS